MRISAQISGQLVPSSFYKLISRHSRVLINDPALGPCLRFYLSVCDPLLSRLICYNLLRLITVSLVTRLPWECPQIGGSVRSHVTGPDQSGHAAQVTWSDENQSERSITSRDRSTSPSELFLLIAWRIS